SRKGAKTPSIPLRLCGFARASLGRQETSAVKYAVLGSAGQLGRDLCPRLPGEVIALTREHADVTRPESLRATLTELRPDVVINCAAYNLVDKVESEPGTAFAVNAWGVRDLALVCRDLDCVLV